MTHDHKTKILNSSLLDDQVIDLSQAIIKDQFLLDWFQSTSFFKILANLNKSDMLVQILGAVNFVKIMNSNNQETFKKKQQHTTNQ